MADFYPVLSRAVGALKEDTPEARRAVYDRAAQVLVAQLRGMNPPIPEAEITRQRLALEEVVARIERERAQVAVGQASVAPPRPAPSAAAVPAPPPPPPETAAEPEPQPRLPPEPLPEFIPETLPESLPEALPEAGPARHMRPPQADAPLPESRAAGDGGAAGRPRIDFVGARKRRQLPWRNIAAVTGVAAAVGAIAVAAYILNSGERSPLPATPPQASAPQAPSAGPKINERVGQPATETPAPAAPQTAAPAGASPSTPPRAEVAVAQRAVLYVEPADPSQQPRPILGRVSWRVEAQNPGQGQPLETVVRADVDIAEAGLSLVFTLRKNLDNAFPASHILGMRFQRTTDDGNGAVREAGVPQFKMEENERGAPLSAITSPLGENLFVSALSRVPVEVERNLDLIRTRNWIDIPVRFASGRRGIIAFEKGVSGDQRIAEALRTWQ